MNKILVGFLSGSVGVLTGAIAGYIFFKKKYEKMYYEKLQEAIDKECDNLRHYKQSIENGEKLVDGHSTPQVENDYAKAVEKLPDVINDPSECAIESRGPQFIDEDEYRFLVDTYETRELQYLSGDGTVLDINDEIVTDPGIYISGLEEQLKTYEDGYTVYILLEELHVVVEMVIIKETYQDLFGEI